jgi:hypothetical protein
MDAGCCQGDRNVLVSLGRNRDDCQIDAEPDEVLDRPHDLQLGGMRVFSGFGIGDTYQLDSGEVP